MTAAEKEIRKAVDTIVADVLYFAGASPLSVANRWKGIADEVVAESEGYRILLRLVPGVREGCLTDKEGE